MRKAVVCTVLLLTVPWVSACGTVSNLSTTPVVGEVGCTVVVSTGTRSAFYEMIRIVGEHTNTNDWWIMFVHRDQKEFVGIDGRKRAINYPKSKILRRGEHRIIDGVMCHCPE